MRITDAGFECDGIPVKNVTVGSESGLRLTVSNLGAAALSLIVPGSDGDLDILLGFEDQRLQTTFGPMFGVTLGRYAGKVCGASYIWNGKAVSLTPNRGAHHSHGGARGFDKRVFQTEEAAPDHVTFLLKSPDGEEGYPGNLDLYVTYRLIGSDTLRITYETVCDQDTLVGIGNHLYWNLYGNGEGNADLHRVRIASDETVRIGGDGYPDGESYPVAGTPLDLREGKLLRECLKVADPQMALTGGSFDHDYVLKAPGQGINAEIAAEGTDRRVEIRTDMPCLHFYLPDFKDMDYTGKGGKAYKGFIGLCLQPQCGGDSVHNHIAGEPILAAGQKRVRSIEYRIF